MKKEKMVIGVQIVLILLAVIGGTYAVKTAYDSINASVSTGNIGVVFVGDSSVTTGEMAPISSSEVSTKALKTTFTVKGASANPSNVYYDVTLKNIDIGIGLLDQNFKFELIKNGTTISEGNFKDLEVEKVDGTLKYYQRAILTSTPQKLPSNSSTPDSYELRIYILDNGENQAHMMEQDFEADLEISLYTSKGGSMDRDKYTNLIVVNPPVPVLADGMIPVIYSNGNWYKAFTDVKDTGTCKLGDVDGNGSIDSNDALLASLYARGSLLYSSKQLCAADVDGDGVVTEDDSQYILRRAVNSTVTFPAGDAFSEKTYVSTEDDWWYNYDNKKWANAVMVRTDKDSNVSGSSSREQYMSAIEGTKILEDDILAYYVWIPRYRYKLFNVNSEVMDPKRIEIRFEEKTDTKSTGSANGEWLTHPAFTFGTDELSGIWVGKFETSGTADVPTIKSAQASLVNQNVSTQFNTSKQFGTFTYLTSNGVSQVDAHMMKNTEWGAVAYLKQSKYGLALTDIANNAYYASSSPYYMAGCGPKSETDLTSTTTTCTSYTSNVGIKASTTGNVYGVYDMSGGVLTDVMGVMETSDGTGLMYSDSGFTTSTLPFGSKYVDHYTYGTSRNDYTRRILGDATGETNGWYSDYAVFVGSAFSWFARGGDCDDGSSAGVFYFSRGSGDAYLNSAFRSTLATQ